MSWKYHSHTVHPVWSVKRRLGVRPSNQLRWLLKASSECSVRNRSHTAGFHSSSSCLSLWYPCTLNGGSAVPASSQIEYSPDAHSDCLTISAILCLSVPGVWKNHAFAKTVIVFSGPLMQRIAPGHLQLVGTSRVPKRFPLVQFPFSKLERFLIVGQCHSGRPQKYRNPDVTQRMQLQR